MAKNSMKLKVKPMKRERNKNKVESSEQDKIKSSLFTLIGVLVFIGIVYGLVLLMEKGGLFEEGYTKPTKDAVEISSEYIFAGSTFTRDMNEYYVLFDDFSGLKNDSYINYLLGKSDIKVYKVDMSKPENKGYSSDSSNPKARKASDLKINDITLIRIKNGKIVNYVESSTKIEEYLSK